LAHRSDFIIAAGVFSYLMTELSQDDFLVWGWRYPFYVAFAINVVALFARLRLVSTPDYTHLLDEHQLDPVSPRSHPQAGQHHRAGRPRRPGQLRAVPPGDGVPAVLDPALRHPFDGRLPARADVGRAWPSAACCCPAWVADKFGRRNTLGTLAALIALFSGFVPTLMDGGVSGQNIFILVGFLLLGMSYGQAAGAVTSNFLPNTATPARP
jgi:MFS family permease